MLPERCSGQWNRAEPCGAPGHKSLSVSSPLSISWVRVITFLHASSMTFPESQQNRLKQSPVREGRVIQRRSSQETTVQPWSKALVPQGMCVCVRAQLCLILCDPRDWSPTGLYVHGIFQARILEWVTISSSRGSLTQRLNAGLLWVLHWHAGFYLAPPVYIWLCIALALKGHM